MLEFLSGAGLAGLFVLSFAAATLLPIGSEWLLVLLLTRHYDPTALVVVATVGNSCGAVTTYLLGRWGSAWLVQRVLRIDAAGQRRGETCFRRYGRWALLGSWLPVVGDAVCLAAGMLRAPFWSSLLLISAGKFGRYLCVVGLTLQALKS